MRLTDDKAVFINEEKKEGNVISFNNGNGEIKRSDKEIVSTLMLYCYKQLQYWSSTGISSSCDIISSQFCKSTMFSFLHGTGFKNTAKMARYILYNSYEIKFHEASSKTFFYFAPCKKETMSAKTAVYVNVANIPEPGEELYSTNGSFPGPRQQKFVDIRVLYFVK